MSKAISEPNLEPLVIEDVIRIRFDQAFDRGKREGLRYGLLTVLAARGLSPSAAEHERIDAERDVERIRIWIGRAAVASSVDGVLE